MGLPMPKTYTKTKSREAFTACGEKRSHSTTYSKVPKRTMDVLPRIRRDDKQALVGQDSPELGERLAKHVNAGEPLCWQEVKPVHLMSQLFHDFGIEHVIDLSPGSGVAAVPCAQNRILYDGFTLNPSHEAWLSAQLDRGILATITDESLDSHDKDFAASVKSHFASTVREAMRTVEMLPKCQDRKRIQG